MSCWQNKSVLITGGSAGLGLAIAEAFAAAGARVAIAARDECRLQQAADRLRQAQGTEPLTVVADVTRDDEVARLVEQVRQAFGGLDVLVNNVGRSARGRGIDTSAAEFRDAFELNFLSTVRMTQAAMPLLAESKGHLVNIGSLASKTAAPWMGAYAVSKFPLAAYSQQLRLELADQGVHILLVCPGPIARADAGVRYNDGAENLPESARQPGGGVKLSGIRPERLAAAILRACQKRQPELVMPAKARLLFALSQLFPKLGDSILLRMLGGK